MSHKLQTQFDTLQKKEKKTYEALNALLYFFKEGKKPECVKEIIDFKSFKKMVLETADHLNEPTKSKICERFNVKHYQRAIVCAQNNSYRDMAIQAALKDLNKEALADLITAIRKECCQVSKQVKELTNEIRRTSPMVEGVKQLWHQVLDPTATEEPIPL